MIVSGAGPGHHTLTPVFSRMTLSFDRAKTLLLVAGLILIAVVGLVALARGVDPIEVAGTLLFVPVFAGFLFFGVTGGAVLGAAAGAAYVALRWPAVQLVGLGALAGQLAARIIGYLAFGLGGGWATSQLRSTLENFELHDDFDDETALGNARSLLATLDLEQARADRYEKVFSVVAAEFKAPDWAHLPQRRQQTVLRELGTKVAAGVRTSDHAAHRRNGDRHVIGVVLPETGAAGARIFADNLHRLLSGLTNSAELRVLTATHPTDPEPLTAIRDLFRDPEQQPAGV